jgi:hypothetical protein
MYVMSGSDFFSRRTEHPYCAKTLADLPAELRQLAEQSLMPDDPAHTIFVIPPQLLPKQFGSVGGMHKVPEQALLFTAQGLIHIRRGNPPERPGKAIYLRGDNLLYAHLSMILLYEKLELCGITNSGLTRIVVEYSVVSHHLVQPALQQLLRLAWGLPNSDKPRIDTTNLLLYELEQTYYKFSSGLRYYALQPDEQLLGYVFQPRIMKKYLHVFRRQVAPPKLLALTQSGLIMIEEGMSSATRYGWFITYCPRNCVERVEIKPNSAWQDVIVHLSRGDVAAERWTKLGNEAALAWQDILR